MGNRRFFNWSRKIRNLSLCRKIFAISIQPFSIRLQRFLSSKSLRKYAIWVCSKIMEHCHLVLNFPPVPEKLSKIQSDPFSLGYSVFWNYLGNFAIWVWVEKYLNLAIWFRISPRCRRCYRNSIRPFSIGLQRFFFFKGS